MSKSRVRPARPFALLIVGVALSCSTACMTAMAVSEIDQQARRRAFLAEQRRLIEHNIETRLAGRRPAKLENNTESIRQALALALPFPENATDNAFPGSVEVTASTHADGRLLYAITASGNFSGPYNQTFLTYAGELRRKLNPPPVFRITLVFQGNSFRHVYPALVQQ